MKAVVIGGSGATGTCLVEALLAADWITEVVVLLRRSVFPENPKLKELIVYFDQLDNWSDLITGDIAFSCMGTTLKAAGSKEAQWKVDFDYQYLFAEIASKNNIPTFVLLSSQNADPDSSFFYMRMKGKLEQRIEQLLFPTLLIFQPGMLLRPNTDRLGEKLGLQALAFFNRLGLLKQLAPTPVSTVANAMLNSTQTAPNGTTRLGVFEINALSK